MASAAFFAPICPFFPLDGTRIYKVNPVNLKGPEKKIPQLHRGIRLSFFRSWTSQRKNTKHTANKGVTFFPTGFLLVDFLLVTSNICLAQLQHTGVKIERIGISSNDTGSVRNRLIVLSCGHRRSRYSWISWNLRSLESLEVVVEGKRGGCVTQLAPENRRSQKERIVLKPSFSWGYVKLRGCNYVTGAWFLPRLES